MQTISRTSRLHRIFPRGILPGLACASCLLDACWADSPHPSVSTSNQAERTAPAAPETTPALSPQRPERRTRENDLVYKDRVVAHWFADNEKFWYRNDLRAGSKEFILVEAESGARQPAFDHAKLAEALSRAADQPFGAEQLPFSEIEFAKDAAAIRFRAAEQWWRCDLATYQCVPAEASPADEKPDAEEAAEPPRSRGNRRGRRDEADRPLTSPDGQWTASIKDHNVMVRAEPDGEEIALSQDGTQFRAYGRLEWAPDAETLVAWRIESAERKEVYLVRSSPPEGGRAILESRGYSLPGDPFPRYELNLFRLSDRAQIKPEIEPFEHEWLRPRLRWNPHRPRFTYEMTDRGHQRFRVVEVDTQNGAIRNVIDERSQTFLWTAHTENLRLEPVNWLERTEEMIYVSESNGWRHLYLIDTAAGRLKNPITSGPWVVRGIDRIDEETRQVWFRAGGVYPDQDPYLVHFGRVHFDGGGLVFLTEGDGQHTVEYSPDRRFLIDTYSRVDLPPVTELRRVEDGRLVCRLETADIRDLQAEGWTAPEVFVAKGRDGTTDIWGILCRPNRLDPDRKHPIIEDIYAGPQGSFVPKSFSPNSRYESLNQLGFVVVKIDGMGTANRSKAFHDVCWKDLKDAGFEDRILWMKAAAAQYPHLDLTRVGIYGTSAGGQNAAGAVLFHPEFYKAAVANCGCHDNRLDKASWNEQWMGYPVGPQYAECSNIDNAHRLQGHLFLIVGEMDNNVPPESTYRFVDALIKAGKDFDFLMVPNGGHGAGGAYAARRREDFFVRHLMGRAPPDRNIAITETTGE